MPTVSEPAPMIGEKTRFTPETARAAVAAREAKKTEARAKVEDRIADKADLIVDKMIEFALSDSGSAIAKQQARAYLLDRLMGSPTQKVETLHMDRIDAEIEAWAGNLKAVPEPA